MWNWFIVNDLEYLKFRKIESTSKKFLFLEI